MIASLICAALLVVAQPELIERTLAIVGGQAITLSDVRAAVTLHLIEPTGADASIAAGTQRYIERVLVLREVQRYVPPEPSDEAITAGVAVITSRFASPAAFQAAMKGVAFSDALLRAWVRDDLRIAAYLDQRFAAAGLPTDDDVSNYFSQHRAEYDRTGTTFEQAVPEIRTRLAQQRRRELVTDWISDLRRRTPVVELLKQ